MFVKLLGIVDIMAALVLLMSGFIPAKVIVIVGIYLIIKGLLFNVLKINLVSIVDAIIGVFMLLGVYAGFSVNFFRVLFFVFLIQKGIFSLF